MKRNIESEKKLLTQESPDWRSTNSHTGQRKEPQVMMERDMKIEKVERYVERDTKKDAGKQVPYSRLMKHQRPDAKWFLF